MSKRKKMTEEQYRKFPAVNKSTLWEMNKSPAHYKYALENPREDTTAFKIGRAIHCAILTPNDYEKQFAVAPAVDRRTKEGKAVYEAFIADAAGKDVLTEDEHKTVMEITRAVLKNPDVVDLLTDCVTEFPLVWTDEQSGLLCKCKVDAMKPGIIVDLKTATDASTETFTREALRYGYDVQAAHYMNAVQTITGELPTWYFIVVEKSAPFAVNVLKADGGFTDHGYVTRQELLERLKECKESNRWPSYGTNDLVLPSWME